MSEKATKTWLVYIMLIVEIAVMHCYENKSFIFTERNAMMILKYRSIIFFTLHASRTKQPLKYERLKK